MKRVTFSDNTYSPKQTRVCHRCKHRNIPPRCNDMVSCKRCALDFCRFCIDSTGDICISCFFDDVFNRRNYVYDIPRDLHEKEN